MRVLHITYWYPNEESPQEGIFIKNHIEGLNSHCQNSVYHVQVKNAPNLLKKKKTENATIYYTRLSKYYRIQEWLTFLVLFNQLIFKRKAKTFDMVNIHIATPLCRYLKILNFFVKKKIVVTEHWTAYYRNFGLKKNNSGLNRMKKIFFKRFKLITVSKALGEDIINFSGNKSLEYSVVPNIIDTSVFKNKIKQNSEDLRFFMLTNWSPEKDPLAILQAIKEINKNINLVIGGDGVQLNEMKNFVQENNMNDSVEFIGRINPENVASQMQSADAFLHSANYETFSVVCAEALCVGCPVLATDIPAIKEYLTSDSGSLIKSFEKNLSENEKKDLWKTGLTEFIDKLDSFDRSKISETFSQKFGKKVVSKSYFNLLKGYLNEE